MKNLCMKIGLVLTVLFFAAESFAQPGPKRFKARKQMQKQRIKHGKKNGEFSRREKRMLKRDRRKTKRMKDRFSEDGEWTKKEKKKMKRRLDKNSRRIKRFKHNDEQKGDLKRRRRGEGAPDGNDGGDAPEVESTEKE
ncbi:MAG: hypothetical protein ACPGJV_06165 [Bacteriovoracaceae bacterium]